MTGISLIPENPEQGPENAGESPNNNGAQFSNSGIQNSTEAQYPAIHGLVTVNQAIRPGHIVIGETPSGRHVPIKRVKVEKLDTGVAKPKKATRTPKPETRQEPVDARGPNHQTVVQTGSGVQGQTYPIRAIAGNTREGNIAPLNYRELAANISIARQCNPFDVDKILRDFEANTGFNMMSLLVEGAETIDDHQLQAILEARARLDQYIQYGLAQQNFRRVNAEQRHAQVAELEATARAQAEAAAIAAGQQVNISQLGTTVRVIPAHIQPATTQGQEIPSQVQPVPNQQRQPAIAQVQAARVQPVRAGIGGPDARQTTAEALDANQLATAQRRVGNMLLIPYNYTQAMEYIYDPHAVIGRLFPGARLQLIIETEKAYHDATGRNFKSDLSQANKDGKLSDAQRQVLWQHVGSLDEKLYLLKVRQEIPSVQAQVQNMKRKIKIRRGSSDQAKPNNVTAVSNQPAQVQVRPAEINNNPVTLTQNQLMAIQAIEAARNRHARSQGGQPLRDTGPIAQPVPTGVMARNTGAIRPVLPIRQPQHSSGNPIPPGATPEHVGGQEIAPVLETEMVDVLAVRGLFNLDILERIARDHNAGSYNELVRIFSTLENGNLFNQNNVVKLTAYQRYYLNQLMADPSFEAWRLAEDQRINLNLQRAEVSHPGTRFVERVRVIMGSQIALDEPISYDGHQYNPNVFIRQFIGHIYANTLTPSMLIALETAIATAIANAAARQGQQSQNRSNLGSVVGDETRIHVPTGSIVHGSQGSQDGTVTTNIRRQAVGSSTSLGTRPHVANVGRTNLYTGSLHPIVSQPVNEENTRRVGPHSPDRSDRPDLIQGLRYIHYPNPVGCFPKLQANTPRLNSLPIFTEILDLARDNLNLSPEEKQRLLELGGFPVNGIFDDTLLVISAVNEIVNILRQNAVQEQDLTRFRDRLLTPPIRVETNGDISSQTVRLLDIPLNISYQNGHIVLGDRDFWHIFNNSVRGNIRSALSRDDKMTEEAITNHIDTALNELNNILRSTNQDVQNLDINNYLATLESNLRDYLIRNSLNPEVFLYQVYIYDEQRLQRDLKAQGIVLNTNSVTAIDLAYELEFMARNDPDILKILPQVRRAILYPDNPSEMTQPIYNLLAKVNQNLRKDVVELVLARNKQILAQKKTS